MFDVFEVGDEVERWGNFVEAVAVVGDEDEAGEWEGFLGGGDGGGVDVDGEDFAGVGVFEEGGAVAGAGAGV